MDSKAAAWAWTYKIADGCCDCCHLVIPFLSHEHLRGSVCKGSGWVACSGVAEGVLHDPGQTHICNLGSAYAYNRSQSSG